MMDDTKQEPVDVALAESDVQARRDFLAGLGKWSMAVIGGVALAGIIGPTNAMGRGGAWANSRGLGGGAWANNRLGGGGGGGWANARGGGGGGWANARGGGGGGWANGRGVGGGGAWANRRF